MMLGESTGSLKQSLCVRAGPSCRLDRLTGSSGCLRRLSLGGVHKCISIIATIKHYTGPQWCCGNERSFSLSMNKNIQ